MQRCDNRHFAQQSKVNKFKIEVVQLLLSPDLNVDDLAISTRIHDVSLVARENRRDLIAAVGKCWYDYDVPRRNLKCLAFLVFVVPGHPRARVEAVTSTSAAAPPCSPISVGEGIQVTAKTIRDAEKLLCGIR